MNRVRVLPEVLANKIAAGEVVERPASVVKELVENALDAGCQEIHLEILNGGRESIRVIDDGCGMSRDDALLAIERHATSKLRHEEDLFAIQTLGFRGEALPSIAAVSKLTLTTTRADDPVGTCVKIEGGRIQSVTDVGAPPGTVVAVDDLFYNVPARSKFLKTISTEMGHIVDVLSRISLAQPDIHFGLQHNQRQVKRWTAVADPAMRVVDVLGTELEGNLIDIDHQREWVAVRGWVARATIVRATTRGIYLYVNNRFVRDRVIQHALLQGFEQRLVRGQYPVAVLNVQVPFDKVDVNVHPAKHEVRFEQQQVVHRTIAQAIRAALGAADKAYWQPNTRAETADTETVHEISIDIPARDTRPLYGHRSSSTRPVVSRRPQGGRDISEPRISARQAPRAPSLRDQTTLFETGPFSGLRILGQLHGTYLVCESKGGLILIDQHAAHERICYEALKNSAQDRKPARQNLLLPMTLELGPVEADAFLGLLSSLNAVGLEIEPFGGTSFVIKAVPVMMMGADVLWMMRDLAETVADIGVPTRDATDLLDRFWMVMACHQSLRAHHDLSMQHAQSLLAQLDQCQHPNNCPHGRPVWVEYTHREIEKAFHRTK